MRRIILAFAAAMQLFAATSAFAQVPPLSITPRGPKGDVGCSMYPTQGQPAPSMGRDCDFAIDAPAGKIWGPKIAGEWGSPVLMSPVAAAMTYADRSRADAMGAKTARDQAQGAAAAAAVSAAAALSSQNSVFATKLDFEASFTDGKLAPSKGGAGGLTGVLQATNGVPSVVPTIGTGELLRDNLPTGVAFVDGHRFMTVPTNAALKALPIAQILPGSRAERAGFYAPYDGGQQTYYLSSANCPISGGNEGAQVQPTSGTGCWYASEQAYLDIRAFGMREGDTTTYSAANAAILTKIFQNPNKSTILVPYGVFRFACGTYWTAGGELKFIGDATFNGRMKLDPGCTLTSSVWTWNGKSGGSDGVAWDLATPSIPASLVNGVVVLAYAADVTGFEWKNSSVVNAVDRMFGFGYAAAGGHVLRKLVVSGGEFIATPGPLQNQCIGGTTVNNAGQIIDTRIEKLTCDGSGIQVDGQGIKIDDVEVKNVAFGAGVYVAHVPTGYTPARDCTFRRLRIHDITSQTPDSNNVYVGGVENNCLDSTISESEFFNITGPCIYSYADNAAITTNVFRRCGTLTATGAWPDAFKSAVTIAYSPSSASASSRRVAMSNNVFDGGGVTPVGVRINDDVPVTSSVEGRDNVMFGFAVRRVLKAGASPQGPNVGPLTTLEKTIAASSAVTEMAFAPGADVAWAASTAVVLGDKRHNGGNVYVVTTAGTTAASGGPSGTGAGIADGTAVWDYVQKLGEAFDPTFRRVTIECSNINTSTASTPQMQFSFNGGATWDANASNYTNYGGERTSGSASEAMFGTGLTFTTENGLQAGASLWDTGNVVNGSVTWACKNLLTNGVWKSCEYTSTARRNTAGAMLSSRGWGYDLSSASPVTGLRIVLDNGAAFTGTCTLRGEM